MTSDRLQKISAEIKEAGLEGLATGWRVVKRIDDFTKIQTRDGKYYIYDSQEDRLYGAYTMKEYEHDR